jgi:hypothetical protein
MEDCLRQKMSEYELKKEYSKGAYNKCDDEEQHIRITEGCPNACEYCAESFENGAVPIYYEIPEIVRNKVCILDMNLIYKPNVLEILNDLGQRKVNGKIVYYELQCGIDWRYLTQEKASALKRNHFENIRFAWDGEYELVYKIKDALNMLIYAGYSPKSIQVFMIANWKISAEEFEMKLRTLAMWGVQVSDCWFDNQTKEVVPVFWTAEQIKHVRKLCRDHNIMIRHNGIQVERV